MKWSFEVPLHFQYFVRGTWITETHLQHCNVPFGHERNGSHQLRSAIIASKGEEKTFEEGRTLITKDKIYKANAAATPAGNEKLCGEGENQKQSSTGGNGYFQSPIKTGYVSLAKSTDDWVTEHDTKGRGVDTEEDDFNKYHTEVVSFTVEAM